MKLSNTLVLLTVVLISACVFTTTDLHSVKKENLKKTVRDKINSPTKIHLQDGSVIIYPGGFTIENGKIITRGRRYNFARTKSTFIHTFPMDSVEYLEYYSKNYDNLALVSSIPGVAFGSRLAFVVIFGSCPTIYSPQIDKDILEAECFSYSISPRYEVWDLDKLDHPAIKDNKITLKIANEALETHYINQFSLVRASHPYGYEAYPDKNNNPVLFGEKATILRARDKYGDDIGVLIEDKDSLHYRSNDKIFANTEGEITRDRIDISFNNPKRKDEMVLLLRLRNTLLNTVLLYDVMLASKGIDAIDWIGEDSQNLFYAWRLHNWYGKHFGMDIEVMEDGEYKKVGHIWDSGPIAWHEQAVRFSIPAQDTIQIRLSYLADNWVIDKINASFDSDAEMQISEISCTALENPMGIYSPDKRRNLTSDDDKYLVTFPGEHYLATFDLPEAEGNRAHTYFIKSKGYYIEWIRKEWLSKSLNDTFVEFELNDETIIQTSKLWAMKKASFEKMFYDMKIPLLQEAPIE